MNQEQRYLLDSAARQVAGLQREAAEFESFGGVAPARAFQQYIAAVAEIIELEEKLGPAARTETAKKEYTANLLKLAERVETTSRLSGVWREDLRQARKDFYESRDQQIKPFTDSEKKQTDAAIKAMRDLAAALKGLWAAADARWEMAHYLVRTIGECKLDGSMAAPEVEYLGFAKVPHVEEKYYEAWLKRFLEMLPATVTPEDITLERFRGK